MILSAVDLPEPLAPRMILVWPLQQREAEVARARPCRRTRADTWSKTTTGRRPRRGSADMASAGDRPFSRTPRADSWVTKKSAAITATEPATTDSVVDLPTPAVPPLVRSPTWHAMVTMMNPKTNGLMIPIQTSCMYRPSVIDDQYTPVVTCSVKARDDPAAHESP